MKKLLFLTILTTLTGCSSLDPVSVSTKEMGIQDKLKFSENSENTIAITKSSIKERGWEILYEGSAPANVDFSYLSNKSHNPFKIKEQDYDELAINKALISDEKPFYFIQAKTPTSAFSYGAEIFIVIYKNSESETTLSMAASSGQALEKEKLPKYLEELSILIDKSID